jgi:hypothetical protein
MKDSHAGLDCVMANIQHEEMVELENPGLMNATNELQERYCNAAYAFS